MGKNRSTFGIFTPYARDCSKDSPRVEATIRGTIPSWLTGIFLVNGPGGQKFDDNQEYDHLFDGPAYLRKFTINSDQVTYEAKYLESETYRKNKKHGKIVVTEFGTRGYPDPCKTMFDRLTSYFFLTDLFNDNNQVTVLKHHGTIYAIGETPLITAIDSASLRSKSSYDIRRYISLSTLASHMIQDWSKGDLYAMGSSFGSYNIIRIPESGECFAKSNVIAQIPFSHFLFPSYYHSFAMTENFFVFIEQPLVLSIPSLLWNHYTGGVSSNIMKWRPEWQTRIHLISRSNGTKWPIDYITKPFAFFHVINAFEDKDHLIVDICCYKDANVLKTLYTKAMREAASSHQEMIRQAEYVQSQAKRFVLPLSPDKEKRDSINLNKLSYSTSKSTWTKDGSIEVESEGLTPWGSVMAEMPTIAGSKVGRKYQYFYALCRRESDLLLELMKCNTNNKEIIRWSENDYYPSEPIFVPNPVGKNEDDGVVLSYVLSEINENQGFLLVLDAHSFTEIARANFTSSARLLPQFHGTFLTDLEQSEI